jgi:hypothetical protein
MSFSSSEVAVGEKPDQPDPDRVGVPDGHMIFSNR